MSGLSRFLKALSILSESRIALSRVLHSCTPSIAPQPKEKELIVMNFDAQALDQRFSLAMLQKSLSEREYRE